MHEVILEDLRARFGIQVYTIQTIEGGWLNEKWKIQSSHGSLIVKRFSTSRYGKSRLDDVQNALIWQSKIEAQGVPCPRIILSDNLPIQRISDEYAYMVMTFSSGIQATPSGINIDQMYSLGKACGQLHQALKAIPLDNIPLASEPTLEFIREKCLQRINALSAHDSTQYARTLHKQAAINNELTEAFWECQPTGLTHRDFAIDNILFDGDNVSAVLDFDTAAHSFLRRDVGRALLSFAFDGQVLRRERVRAFGQGYAIAQKLSLEDMANAMRLVWCLEATTWLHFDLFNETRGKVARFRDETIWMMDHWHELESLMQ